MSTLPRAAQELLRQATRGFPAVVVTGPRRSGKTTLLRAQFPDASYVLLEDPDIRQRALSDPRGLLDDLRLPAIFDEIQNVPDLFAYIRSRIDAEPRRMGRWLFTGSQEAPLMRYVGESMAGRAAIMQLLPFSLAETPRASLLYGGYPEVVARPGGRALWFSSYLQTYLERDVRAVTGVRDLATFRRFLSLLAARHGQLLNRSDIAAPLGVSVPTVNEWLSVLELTGQIILVPPYFENLGKRLIRSPKVYIGDSGLACYLLGITSQAELDRSPFLGTIFEGFVAAEILKSQINFGRRKELYHFRDHQGLEVDFLFPGARGELNLVECKASRTPQPSMAGPMLRLRKNIPEGIDVRMTLVHRPAKYAATAAGRALAPGAQAVDLPSFVADLNGGSLNGGIRKVTVS